MAPKHEKKTQKGGGSKRPAIGEVSDRQSGGKKLKLEEQQQEESVVITAGEERVEKRKPPFICAIYRRDIAYFLPRAKVEGWRLLSRFANDSLRRYASMLPRRTYPKLTIGTRTWTKTVKKDGYVAGYGDRQMKGTPFHEVFGFKLCCQDEIKEKAKCLIGELVFPNKPANEVVFLQLKTDKPRYPYVAYRALNRLTEKTARGLLHFAKHFRGARFELVSLQFDGDKASEEHGKLNPSLLQVLSDLSDVKKKFRVYADKMGKVMGGGTLDASTVKTAQQLVGFRSLHQYAGHDALHPLLSFLSTGRALTQQMAIELSYVFQPNCVDSVLQYFAKTVKSFNDVVPSVLFSGMTSWPWPRSCPKQQAISHIGDVEHTFRYKNVHSKENFQLVLRMRPDPYSYLMDAMLTFSPS